MIYDVAIIGGGAAGLSAAIYAARGGMSVVVFEGTGYGGQVNFTPDVDNYPAFPLISGEELSQKLHAHAAKFPVEFKQEQIREISDYKAKVKKLVTRKNVYEVRTVILATGAKPRKLAVQGEELAGVSYCATCDGAFAKGKTAVVVGGGNTAFEDALYLSAICKKVYILNRSESFRAAKTLVEKAKNSANIEILTSRKIEKIQGTASVTSVVTSHAISGRISVLDTDYVFVAIGRIPESGLYDGKVLLADDKSVICNEHMATDITGLFAAGDVRKTPLRQIVTAAADGAVAATAAINYILTEG